MLLRDRTFAGTHLVGTVSRLPLARVSFRARSIFAIRGRFSFGRVFRIFCDCAVAVAVAVVASLLLFCVVVVVVVVAVVVVRCSATFVDSIGKKRKAKEKENARTIAMRRSSSFVVDRSNAGRVGGRDGVTETIAKALRHRAELLATAILLDDLLIKWREMVVWHEENRRVCVESFRQSTELRVRLCDRLVEVNALLGELSRFDRPIASSSSGFDVSAPPAASLPPLPARYFEGPPSLSEAPTIGPAKVENNDRGNVFSARLRPPVSLDPFAESNFSFSFEQKAGNVFEVARDEDADEVGRGGVGGCREIDEEDERERRRVDGAANARCADEDDGEDGETIVLRCSSERTLDASVTPPISTPFPSIASSSPLFSAASSSSFAVAASSRCCSSGRDDDCCCCRRCCRLCSRRYSRRRGSLCEEDNDDNNDDTGDKDDNDGDNDNDNYNDNDDDYDDGDLDDANRKDDDGDDHRDFGTASDLGRRRRGRRCRDTGSLAAPFAIVDDERTKKNGGSSRGCCINIDVADGSYDCVVDARCRESSSVSSSPRSSLSSSIVSTASPSRSVGVPCSRPSAFARYSRDDFRP